jgi:hypothetical protein
MNNSKVIKRNVSVIQFSDGSGLYQICSIRKKKILIEADIKSNSFWKNNSNFGNTVTIKDKSLLNFKKLFSNP